jgi:ribonucleoside-diphosphate reductase alpha chain
MRVLKRNGQYEYFDFKKIEKVIRYACPSEEHVEKFISEWQVQIKDGMTTKELQASLIQFASEQITVDQPEWEKIAAKLFLYDLIKEAGINRGYKRFGYGGFYKLIKDLTDKGLYDPLILESYSRFDIDELDQHIQHGRDDLLTYVGITTLAKRYCIVGHNKEVYELPQEAFMGVAMKIATAEEPENRLKWAKQFYDIMSQLFVTEATPTMSNARKPHGQLSSCFIGMPGDSLDQIMHQNGDMFAQVSKYGGGMGIYIGKVRALGSNIRNFKNMSGGTIPWIRIMNDTAIACDQLGVRSGAVSITLDVWHRDILEFLELKTNNGDLRRKAPDIFPSISIPDVYMKQCFSSKQRVRNGKFYLFCPHEIRQVKGWSLEDFWGEEFEQKYWECVDDDRIRKDEIDAMDIMLKIAESDGETGTPFLFFRDTVNRDNPNKHKGMIYATNLCVEICQNMNVQGEGRKSFRELEDGTYVSYTERSVGDFVVCNLATINLGKVHTKEKINEIVPILVRMLDDVITINELPVVEATITNMLYRAIGIGWGGYHHMLALNGVTWESDEHLQMAAQVGEWIFLAGVRASAELGLEKGSYRHYVGSEWNTGEFFFRHGLVGKDKNGNIIPVEDKEEAYEVCLLAMQDMRNGWLFAIAPTGSSSHYGGYTQSIDPIFDWVFIDEKKKQLMPIVAPDLDKIPRWYYKSAHKIDQKWSIRAAAVRQKFLDQSQSFNLYITPETTGEDLLTYYAMIWKLEIKTKYYTRNQSADIEDCEGCSA